MTSSRLKVGIVGGTGYTGAELLRLLLRHPQVEVSLLTSRKEAGQRVDAWFPSLRGQTPLCFEAPDAERLAACDAVFFATPHATAMEMAPALLQRGVRVIDLSADFRLRDPAEFQRWYAHAHSAPALLAEAVYGLPEARREAIRQARLVACPGCYPTAVQLALLPLLEARLIDPASLIADCKSGVSGAGREAKIGSLFGECADTFKAYGVAGHRHLPEIRQELARAAGEPVGLVFVPHLTPLVRGIHATVYARVTAPGADLQTLFERRYAGEPFVDVMPAGSTPETRSVRASNHCRIALQRAPDSDVLVVMSVIDNLVKGASGQAVQCFNLMFGLAETQGLDVVPVSP